MKDMETFGGKIRDTEGEFAGADFRDEKTGLMFAYDYENKFTIRVWGTTFKPALYKRVEAAGREDYRPDGGHGASGKAGKGKETRHQEPWA